MQQEPRQAEYPQEELQALNGNYGISSACCPTRLGQQPLIDQFDNLLVSRSLAQIMSKADERRLGKGGKIGAENSLGRTAMVPTTRKLTLIDGVIHIEQSDPPRLLSRTLSLTGYSRENCFTASDLNLYYNVRHPLWHKRPDWFLVVDVPRLYEQRDLRRSYVLWQEGNPPVVVEFLSPGTEAEDLGRFYDEPDEGSAGEPTTSAVSAVIPTKDNEPTKAKPPGKFEVYEARLRVPHYFVYSRYTQRLRYFKLEGGQY